MELQFSHAVLVFLGIGFAGFIDSIAGGGGLITIPTYLLVGVPAPLVLGTNKAVSTLGTSLAVSRYWKNRLMNWRVLGVGIPCALIGSFIGAQYAGFLSEAQLYGLLAMMGSIVLLVTARSRRMKGQDVYQTRSGHEWKAPEISLWGAAIVSLVVGAYDGFFGPGTGSFLLIGLMFFAKIGLKESAASGRMLNFSSNLSAFVSFMISGSIYWSIVPLALGGALLGNWLGSQLVLKGEIKILRKVIMGVFLFTICVSILKALN